MHTLLLTNDDGIDSAFFRALVEVALERYEVYVAAPATEQSWIGRALSRHKEVTVEERADLGCRAWAISGTPSDCVNIALGHLLPKLPDAVVSGINVGYNLTVPLITCSGTVAAAFEGAAWGLHAMALSHYLADDFFEKVKANPTELPDALRPSLRTASTLAMDYLAELIKTPPRRYTVHNLNFPSPTTEGARIIPARPAHVHLGTLFDKVGERTYKFGYHPGKEIHQDIMTDRAVVRSGNISLSVLDFTNLTPHSTRI